VIFVETESYHCPNLVGLSVGTREGFNALDDTIPVTATAILFIAVLIPAIKTPVYFILVVQYQRQISPPLLTAIATVGDQSYSNGWINLFHPGDYWYQISAIYGISIIATQGYFAHVLYTNSTNLLLKKI